MINTNWLEALERVLLAVWIGGACGVGYVAVPTLFANLADRQLAGGLAGSMFKVVAIVGIVAVAVLLLLRVWRGVWANWRTAVLVVAGLGVAVGLFILQPQMAELKAQGVVPGSAEARQFGMLHGIASGVYMLTTVLGLVLLAAGGGPRRT